MIQAYSKAKDGDKKLSANFKVREFSCTDGSDPVFIDSDLVAILQKIRDHFGRAVTITSAYRTPTKNKAVGGEAYSQHLYGRAADIKVNGIAPSKVADYAETILPKGGVGRYKTFAHVDVRGTRARWRA